MMDLQSQSSTNVKKELQETVKLDDGSDGYAITEVPSQSNIPSWRCHVCSRNITTERALFNHLAHPIHRSKLRAPTHPASNFKTVSRANISEKHVLDNDGIKNKEKKEKDGNSTSNSPFAAIDGVVPGEEGIVNGNCQLQKTLDNFKSSPLIGLEYIVELVNENGKGEPRYACMICEKRGDPRSVMVHLSSPTHYLKYISCFFRSTGNALIMLPKTPENRRGMLVAVTKIAEAIETHYGRLKPTVAIAETFAAKKYEILREIEEKDHFRETPHTSFLDLVQPNKIKQYAQEQDGQLNSALKRKADLMNDLVPKPVAEAKSTMDSVLPPPHLAAPAPKLTPPLSKPSNLAPPSIPSNPTHPSIPSNPAPISEPSNPAPPSIPSNPARPPMMSNPARPPLMSNPAHPPMMSNPACPPMMSNPARPPMMSNPAPISEPNNPVPPSIPSNPAHPTMVSYPARQPMMSNPARPPMKSNPARPPMMSNPARPPMMRNPARPPMMSNPVPSSQPSKPDSTLYPISVQMREEEGTKNFVFQPYQSFSTYDNRSIAENQGQEHQHQQPESEDDDVIIVGEEQQECIIEVNSLSSISSDSDDSSARKKRAMPRRRQRKRSRERCSDRDRRVPTGRSYSRSRRSRTRSRDRYRKSYDRESSPWRRHGRYSEERRRGYSPHKRDKSHERIHRSRERRDQEKIKEGTPDYKRISESENKRKWDKYLTALNKLELEYEQKLKYYEDNPEKHPAYSEEWKIFWNRRYKEIQQTGEDAKTYNFKPDWIIFWDKRMRELNNEELGRRREELIKKMGVHLMRDKGPSDELQDISPPSPERGRDTFDDLRNTWKAMTGSDISAPPNDKRSPSPWEEYEKPKHRDMHMPKKHDKEPPLVRSKFNPSPPVIHCLRMLSVLENQLGSLGPKVLDLLARALALEKSGTSESKRMLDDQDIHIFFETAKEKIRGQLLAGIVERNFISPSHAIIKAIDKMLLAHPPKIKQTLPQFIDKKPARVLSEPVQVPGVGMIDKVAVAQQIACALVAQGRSDVTTDELEELINAVVGIAEASNTTLSSNTSSADFFSQLNLENSTAASHINDMLGNMISAAQKTAVFPVEQMQLPAIAPGETQLKIPDITSAQPVPTLRVLPQTKIDIPATKMRNNKEDVKIISPEPELKVTDEELKEKLINFGNLSRDEQQELILILKDLESTQPERVESFRKYVSIGLAKNAPKDINEKKEEEKSTTKPTSRLSPFSSRTGNATPSKEETMKFKSGVEISDDEDDDDYSIEDVYKAASEKAKPKDNLVDKPCLINEESRTSNSSFLNMNEPNIDVRPTPTAEPTYSKPDVIINQTLTSLTKPEESIFNKLFPGNSISSYGTVNPPTGTAAQPFSQSYIAGSRSYNYQGEVGGYNENHNNPGEDEYSSNSWKFQERNANVFPLGENQYSNGNQEFIPNPYHYYRNEF